MIDITTLKNNVYDYLFALLIIILPFSRAVPNLIMGILLLIYIVNFKKQQYINYFKSPFFFLFLLVCYIIFKAFLNNSFLQDFVFYKKYFYLIIVPVLVFRLKSIQLIKIISIITINATILISIFKIIHFYYYFNFIPFADGWAANAVLVLERPYMGIFCLIAIIFSFEQMILQTKKRSLFIISFILPTFFLFFISIRISILTVLILFIIYGLFYYKIAWKKKTLFLSIIVLLFTSIFLLNKNISKRFFINENFDKTIQTFKNAEPRVIIWDCGIDIMAQNTFSQIFGTTSYSNIEESLRNCYSEKVQNFSRRNWFVDSSFNTHNQFLDLYLIGGLISLLLFIFFFIKSIFQNRKSFSFIAVMVSFIMILLIENIFHRQFGCFIFTIFTALLINRNVLKENGKD